MKGKKILIVSNAYPSIFKKYSGIFVKNQYEKLLKIKGEEETIEIFFIPRTITSFFGSFIKYIKHTLRFLPIYFKKYDVVHLHFFYPLIILVYFYKLFYSKSKLIVTFHGSDINFHVKKQNAFFLKVLAKKIDFAIPVGQEISNQIKLKLNLQTGKMLPVGVDDKIFFNLPNEDKKYDIIYVGSFIEVKGIDILYEVVKSFDDSIKICLVGKGNEYEKKFKELQNNNYTNITIKLDQSHDQLRYLYNQSKFLVSLSRSEGFPTATLEAMYCGIPVLTSDIPQFKEQVQEGVNGFTFSTNNIIALKEFILEKTNLPTHEYKKLANGAMNSHKNFSLSIICNELLKIYRS